MTTRFFLALALGALFGCDGRTCDDCEEPDAGRPPGTDAGLPPTTGCEGVDLAADGVLDLALATVRVSGRLTFDGAPAGEYTALSFTRADGHASREVTVEPDGTFAARVVPGTYDVRYAGSFECGVTLPCGAGVLREGVALVADGVLDIDVDVVSVSGRATLDGAAWPVGALGSITFAQGEDSTSVELDESTGAYDLRLLPGTYDVVYASTTSFCAGPAPCGAAVLRGGLALEADGVVDLDVRAIRITGALTLEGAASSESARIVLSNDEGSIDLGTFFDATYSVVIVPGTYDVLYQPPASCSVAAPCVPGILRDAVSLSADGVLDVDVPSVTVQGTVTLNGAPMPEGTDRGSIGFYGDGAIAVGITSSGPATYALALLPGTYDIGFGGRFTDCDLPTPCNAGVLRSAVAIPADGVIDVDVPAVQVSGTLRVDGAPVGAALFVENDDAPVSVPVASDGTYRARLLPGVYDFLVVPASPSECAPFCGLARAQVDVSLTADGVLDLAVETASVTGRVTIDGAAPAGSSEVRLTEVVDESGGGASVPAGVDGAYAARVPRGRYVVGWTAACDAEALCGNVNVLGCP